MIDKHIITSKEYQTTKITRLVFWKQIIEKVILDIEPNSWLGVKRIEYTTTVTNWGLWKNSHSKLDLTPVQPWYKATEQQLDCAKYLAVSVMEDGRLRQ